MKVHIPKCQACKLHTRLCKVFSSPLKALPDTPVRPDQDICKLMIFRFLNTKSGKMPMGLAVLLTWRDSITEFWKKNVLNLGHLTKTFAYLGKTLQGRGEKWKVDIATLNLQNLIWRGHTWAGAGQALEARVSVPGTKLSIAANHQGRHHQGTEVKSCRSHGYCSSTQRHVWKEKKHQIEHNQLFAPCHICDDAMKVFLVGVSLLWNVAKVPPPSWFPFLSMAFWLDKKENDALDQDPRSKWWQIDHS